MAGSDENQTLRSSTPKAPDEDDLKTAAAPQPEPASDGASRAPLYYIIGIMLALGTLLAYGALSR
jgi:hypothetical protein